MTYGVIPLDDNDKPVLALWDDATETAIPVHIKSKVQGADGKWYAILDTNGGVTTVQQFIDYYIGLGQGFQATTGLLATATTGNISVGLGLLNNSTAKNCLIYSIQLICADSSQSQYFEMNAMDAALTNPVTPLNLQLGSSNNSLMTVKSSPNGVSTTVNPAGTVLGAIGQAGNTINELLTNGKYIILPANQTQGIEALIYVVTAGHKFGFNISYIEY